MKLKELFYMVGLKPKPREYLFDVDTYELSREGEIRFARWRHPKEQRKEVTQRQVDALRRFLKPGDSAIDIGAHTGDTTLPIALAVGAEGAVFALEPNRYVYKILLANTALNREKTNIYPLMFASTDVDGEFEFEYSDPGYCNGGKHEGISASKHAHFFKLDVSGRNLPNYLTQHFPERAKSIRFIKIDTEGYDHQVVRSLEPLIEQCHPFIRSEIFRHTDEASRMAYHETLQRLGYRIYHMPSEEDYRGELLTENDMMKWDHFDVFAVHDMHA